MSLNKKETALIKMLTQQQTWLSATYLSEALSTSTRTIRNYVYRINQKAGLELIVSSRQGYQIDCTFGVEELLSQNKRDVYTPKDRLNYLMNLLIQHRNVDYFDVAETLFVSVPTIEKDTLRLRKKLCGFNLTLVKHGQFLSMEGEEVNFRRLASTMLQDEALQSFQSLDYIQSIFPDISIQYVQKIVMTCLNQQHLYVNGYAMNSLLLHIAIAINRLLHNQRSEMVPTPLLFSDDQMEHLLAKQIALELNQSFQVEMDQYEVYNLTLLLMTKISPSNDAFLKNYMDTSIYTFVEETMQLVSEKYFIATVSADLILNLALHVSNLITRAKNGKQVRNPLAEEIKQSYAFIYEVAVFIAKQIQKNIQMPITDDEITFIALHIGSYFEEKFETENKLSCMIYTPEYYDLHQRLIYKVGDTFKSSLTILGSVHLLNNEDIAELKRADLVLTTIDLPDWPNGIHISPFLSQKDIDKIQKQIHYVQNQQLQTELKEGLTKYLTPERFERNIYLDTPEEYIEHLGGQLVHAHYIDRSFIELIKEREKMSATSFNNSVALPHAIEMSAKKTGVSIIINKHPIKWDTHYVQVIIMIVMNQSDTKKFRQLFDFMIDTFSNQERLKHLLDAENYEQFIEKLFTL
ncbi:BglG family transcription antiterminator [Carnobacterium gallinarum]|uniref:BglG family transcription antiterminator n=1 Tax=Carnobacterium gallinarum TaxID=2749 RepID=UPI00055476EF|nr:PTS sugar transporter subunit IIA [Carnobacterium gallinarum]